MKKFVAFVAFAAALSFTSCGNKSAESTEAVAEIETVVEETTVASTDSTVVTPADSAAVEVTPAN